MEIDELGGYQEASREAALVEMAARNVTYNHDLVSIRGIDEAAIEEYEHRRSEYDFGWERVCSAVEDTACSCGSH